MKVNLLVIMILFCATQFSFSQEDGVASLEIPVRNSLRFNKFVINPTFSFVREQNKYLSFSNKREWVQFNDAPLTYLASYSGRFKENIGIGVGLFQKNYGVLTSFGGILNFAYNARLQQDSHLTFGLNLGLYNSGINKGKVITNIPDPSLNNIPSHFLLSISPGINYGAQFFDFGVSVNNLVQYNLRSSEIIKEDPQQTIQAHIMYTGYMDSHGFFDESKFSTLIRTEFKKDHTIVSGIAMLTVPKGIWGQVGYNTTYGVSGGIGMNITEQIAIEYNFEKTIGDLETFGSSHDITLAYKFKKKESFYYSGDDEESAFVIPKKRRRRVLAKSTTSKADREKRAQAKAEEEARIAEEKLKEVELEVKAKAEEDARLAAQAAAKAKAKEEARIAEEKLKEIELKAKVKAEEDARLAAQAAAKAKAKEEARIAEEKLKEIELKAKAKAEKDARLVAQAAAKAKTEEEARIAEEKLKEIELNAKAEKERLEAKKAVPFEITHKDELAKSMFNITALAKETKIKQEDLLARLDDAIEDKNKDLKDLKEENDLSEQGIYKAPKPFKSVTEQNRALEALKLEVDNIINEQNNSISELEKQYNNRIKNVKDKNDATNEHYRNAIKELKDEQEATIRSKALLISRLQKINIDLEFERNRRIKRALYDNEEDRYQKDRAAFDQIKQSIEIGANRLLKEENFDFGEDRVLDNIQIVKNVNHIDEGYYIVLAVHIDSNKRDEFLRNVILSGQTNIDFFYDINSSKYFIYSEKVETIEAAQKVVNSNRNSKPYNSKMSIVKIEK